MHPAQATAELKSMTTSWDVRHADYEFCMAAETGRIIAREGIQILSFAQLQDLWRRHSL